nr:fructose-specific PTS transporter subunit EIIC [Wenjunlia tyrosinilytica]
MTGPDIPRERAGRSEPGLKLLAVTACPTGIAHTYMAAEKLSQAAAALGHTMKVETQGSIGVENALSDNDVREADAVIVAADKDVDTSRFAGKRLLVVGVAEGIRHPERLVERALAAPVHRVGGSGGSAAASGAAAGTAGGGERSAVYKALMNGVSYMIPFVVVGGLLIAISLALGGDPKPDGGLVIPEGTFWKHVNDIGVIGFTLMVPVLSGYIAYAIGDRPALVPGMIGGWIANTGALYDSKSGAGFIGAIVTGFLAGHLVLWIKKVKVPKFAQPIMPIIVIPIVATVTLGLFFIYVIGKPIAWVFENLTDWLSGMTGTSAALLGIILGLMIAFDMGGPVNKTAFLFGAGLVSKNPEIMGMCAAAIPVPPLGVGLATVIRRGFFTEQEQETGYAALFMGCFGITEGAIPFAAARPARIIPANMIGGAVAGAVAGVAGVEDSVPHGGPIVAVLGAIGGVPMFFVAVLAGTAATALTAVALIGMRHSGKEAGAQVAVPSPAPERELAMAGAPATATGAVTTASTGDGPAGDTGPGTATSTGDASADVPAESPADDPVGTPTGEPGVLCGYLTSGTVKEQLVSRTKKEAIEEMADLLASTGKVADKAGLIEAALAREVQGTTGLGEEIAIPHAKSDAVTAPVVGFARSAEGIEWGSLDGTTAKLVFMISVPEAAAGDEHLRILALLSRRLVDADFRARLQAAPTREEIMRLLAEIR